MVGYKQIYLMFSNIKEDGEIMARRQDVVFTNCFPLTSHPFLVCGGGRGILLQSTSQRTQSAGPVRFFIFCSISIFLLASLMVGRRPSVLLVHRSRECTPPYLSTGTSHLLQLAQAEVMLGQHSSTNIDGLNTT